VVKEQGTTVTLGEKIATLRKERHWSQDQFGEKVGVHGRHVSRWENGHQRPAPRTLKKIAQVLGVTVDELEDDAPELPASSVYGPEMVKRVEKLQNLDPKDRAMIFHLIDTLATHQQLKTLITTESPA